MAAPNSIFADLTAYIDRVAKLLRLDAALLSIETKENLSSAGISIALIFGALMIASLGIIILLFANVLLLIQLGLAPSLAALLVAASLFVIATALATVAIQPLKKWSLMPRRAFAQFTCNLHALQASLRNDTLS